MGCSSSKEKKKENLQLEGDSNCPTLVPVAKDELCDNQEAPVEVVLLGEDLPNIPRDEPIVSFNTIYADVPDDSATITGDNSSLIGKLDDNSEAARNQIEEESSSETESEESIPQAPEPTRAITPKVGFVLKTKREGDQSKVFINVYYHEEKELQHHVLSSPAKRSMDKKGVECEAYDVSVPKHYFLKCSTNEEARKFICEDSIHLINDRYSEDLSISYVLPNIKKGFIGDNVSEIEIPESIYCQAVNVVS